LSFESKLNSKAKVMRQSRGTMRSLPW